MMFESVRIRPEYVHRSRPDQTFLDMVTPTPAGLTGTLTPRGKNRYYAHLDGHRILPFLYAIEALRQAETYYAHSRLKRDDRTRFVWTTILARRVVSPGESSSAMVDSRFTLTHVKRLGSQHHYSGIAQVDDDTFIVDDLGVGYIDVDAYASIRGPDVARSDTLETDTRDVRPSPLHVGRASEADVAIARGSDGGFRIAADYGSPVFFEHPQDHWPGMVILDGASQWSLHMLSAAEEDGLVDTGLTLSSIVCTFVRYGELTSPLLVIPRAETYVAQGVTYDVDLVQQGQRVASLSIRFG